MLLSTAKMSLQVMITTMSSGMVKTCLIFILTLVGSLPLGMIVAMLGKSKILPVKWLIDVYLAVIRGTPLMLQLLVWHFGPYYLHLTPSIRGWKFPAIIIGFVVNYSAYFAEIYRGGIESIPKGQYEAAEVLGYSKVQTFFIILPQVIKRVMPSVTNEVITLVKDTSLAFTLAEAEVFSLAKQISASQVSFTPFVIAGVFYFCANYLVAFIMKMIEKSMDYYR